MNWPTVTTVTTRDISHRVTPECYRDNRDNTLWGVTYVTLPQPMADEDKEAKNWACDLGPTVADIFAPSTGRSTDLLSLPTSEKKSGEKSW
ncbi:MAG: hypothetical protein VX378_15595 [Pseudomonadota bacterium]|nr:hypothetical protein [Pseudomonadota bacterium]MEE3072521.1 hypothetical protein [Pseudomonadota bacterium]